MGFMFFCALIVYFGAFSNIVVYASMNPAVGVEG